MIKRSSKAVHFIAAVLGFNFKTLNSDHPVLLVRNYRFNEEELKVDNRTPWDVVSDLAADDGIALHDAKIVRNTETKTFVPIENGVRTTTVEDSVVVTDWAKFEHELAYLDLVTETARGEGVPASA